MKKSLMSAFGKWTGLGRKPVAFSVNQHRSNEGIDFALLSYNSGPTASLSFAFEGGSSANAPGNPVTAMLFPQTFMESAVAVNSKHLSETLMDLECSLFINVLPDAMLGSITAPFATLADAVEVCGRTFRETDLTESAFHLAKRGTAANLQNFATDPHTIVQSEFVKALYGDSGHFAHRFVTEDEIQASEISDVSDFQSRYLVRNNLYVAVAGDLLPDKTGALVDMLFAGLPAGNATHLEGPTLVNR